MRDRPIILSFPPLLETCFWEPYPSLPVLASVLKKEGWNVIQLDLNSDFLDWFVQSSRYRASVGSAGESVQYYEGRSSISRPELARYMRAKRILELDRLLERNRLDRKSCVQKIVFEDIPSNGDPRTVEELRVAVCSTDEVWRLMREFYHHYFEIKRFEKPCFIGIALAMGPQLVPGLRFARWVKYHVWPDVPIFCGGPLTALINDDVRKLVLKQGV